MSFLRVNKVAELMSAHKRSYARHTTEGIALLSQMIRHGRKQRKMTEMELAERLGIARSTLQRLEKGDPKVEIGLMFEAAHLVGIRLFDLDEKGIRDLSQRITDRIAILPKHVRKPKKALIDAF